MMLQVNSMPDHTHILFCSVGTFGGLKKRKLVGVFPLGTIGDCRIFEKNVCGLWQIVIHRFMFSLCSL